LRRALLGIALAAALAVVLLLTRSSAPPPEPVRTTAPEAAAPEAPAVAPAPSAAPAAAEPVDAEAERRAEMRAQLEASIAEHLPDRKLSSDQLDAATDALLRLRAAHLELAALPRRPENAERLRELTEAIGQASLDFEYVVDLDPVEFTERASEDDE
jgi:hypothetical protein